MNTNCLDGPVLEINGKVKQYIGTFYNLLETARTLPDVERVELCTGLLLALVELVKQKVPINLQERVNMVKEVLGPGPDVEPDAALQRVIDRLLGKIIHEE
jgi:hypothetical protein